MQIWVHRSTPGWERQSASRTLVSLPRPCSWLKRHIKNAHSATLCQAQSHFTPGSYHLVLSLLFAKSRLGVRCLDSSSGKEEGREAWRLNGPRHEDFRTSNEGWWDISRYSWYSGSMATATKCNYFSINKMFKLWQAWCCLSSILCPTELKCFSSQNLFQKSAVSASVAK